MNDSTTRLRPTFSLEEDRLNALQQILPEAFADGRINFDTLRELLGDDVDDAPDEHFGLSWTGKKEARRLAGLPSKGTLVPAAGEGVDEATTENIFIEGDNLEVLKLLHKSYRGRVKMIYIDPPYNTGNDFIYKDDYREPLESYLERSGQMSDAGELLSSNPKSSGRFHSNWMDMIYSRVRVAKDLLREDGVIFASIDDSEVHNLKQMMNEIFGEENFIGQLVWKKKYIGGKHAKHFVDFHEYVLVFAKNNLELGEFLMDRPEAELEKFELEDEYVNERGRHYIRPLKSNLGRRATLIYPIQLPDGNTIETQWMVAPNTFEDLKKAGRIIFKERRDGSFNVYRKYYENDNSGNVKVPSLIDDVYNADGKVEIKELFEVKEGRDIPFDNPKPTGLLAHLLKPVVFDDEIVLDFFAGSATTAHAIFELNKDKRNRKFICIQLPEITPKDSEARKAGYERISDVSKERIRRAIKKIKSEQNGDSPLLQQAETSGGEKQDLGFKVFRLERSNFRAWTDYTGQELADFRPLLESFESPFVAEAAPDAILTEILLLEGFPLNSKVAPDNRFERNLVVRVESEFSEHRLFVTLDEEVWEETIDRAAELEKNDIFICLDNALDDQNKVSLADVCRLKVI